VNPPFSPSSSPVGDCTRVGWVRSTARCTHGPRRGRSLSLSLSLSLSPPSSRAGNQYRALRSWQKLRRVYEPVYCTERARYSGAFWRVAEYPQLIAITVLYERTIVKQRPALLSRRVVFVYDCRDLLIKRCCRQTLIRGSRRINRARQNLRFWSVAERLIGHLTCRLRMFVVCGVKRLD